MEIEPVFFSTKFIYLYALLRGFGLPVYAENFINSRHNFTAVYFVQHKNYVLNVEGINSFLVAFPTECALRCAQHELCLSFNIGVKRHKGSSNFLCKILPATTFTALPKLEESKNFYHWSIFVSIAFRFTSHLRPKHKKTKFFVFVCLCLCLYHSNFFEDIIRKMFLFFVCVCSYTC